MEVHPYWLALQERAFDLPPGVLPVTERVWLIATADTLNHAQAAFPGATISGPYTSLAAAEGVRARERQRHHVIGAGDVSALPSEVVHINPPT